MLSMAALKERRKQLVDEANAACDKAVAAAQAAGGHSLATRPGPRTTSTRGSRKSIALDREERYERNPVLDATVGVAGSALRGSIRRGFDDQEAGEAGTAASMLPALSGRTRAVVERLYNDVGATDRRETRGRFREAVARGSRRLSPERVDPCRDGDRGSVRATAASPCRPTSRGSCSCARSRRASGRASGRVSSR